MNKDSKLLLAAMAIIFAWSIYSHNSLSQEIAHTQQFAKTCSCPQSNQAQVNGLKINSLLRLTATSHSYAEHLLEGLVRHSALPLAKAREACTKGMESYGGMPEGWRWLEAWETP